MISAIDANQLNQNHYTDIGGPAITVGLFNYFGNGNKDLVVSCSIIPQGDNTKDLVVNQLHDPPALATVRRTIRTISGFTSFSTPHYVVSDINQTFTGSIRLELEPLASTGISTLFHKFGPGFANQNYQSSSFEASSLFVQTVAGRSKVGGIENITGRTIFGRTTLTPPLTGISNLNLSKFVSSGTAGIDEDIVYYTTEKHTKAPYLLMPNDKLFLSLSKYRSTFVSTSLSSNRPLSPYATTEPDGQYWFYHSSSHDVGISVGTIRLSLYGSLIKEGTEFHDTLNSRLDTDQVHEIIGAGPIVDEFDVFYSSELSGSSIDRFITGSILATTNDARQRIFSLSAPEIPTKFLLNGERGNPFDDRALSRFLTPSREVSTNFRNNQCMSSEERFWDSLVPDIIGVNQTNKGAVNTSLGFGATQITNQINLDTSFGGADLSWTKSFPFEPCYSTVPRVNQDKLRFRFSTTSTDSTARNVEGQFTVGIPEGGDGTIRYFVDGPVANFVSNNNSATYTQLLTGLSANDLFKVFFGIGELNTMYVPFGGTSAMGCTQFASFRIGAVDTGLNQRFLHKPVIRGWKYGLISGLPLFTKAVFRRDRYGFMRDMLEQRPDTKFSIQGTSINTADSVVRVSFVNSNNNVVLPEKTFSSNLSFEVTSSLPYFDGIVRNREEPISFAKANQSIVVI